jgi:putative phage-type endonuclease
MDVPTYLNDLGALTNIIDSLVIPPSESNAFSADDQVDIVGTIMQLMYDYVIENPAHIQNATFHNDMMESVEELIRGDMGADGDDGDDDAFDDMTELVNQAIDLFYMQIMPKRSTDMSISRTNKTNTNRTYRTRQVLAHLNALPQPAQRTNEWYAFRHALITASNAYKIFDTPGSQNQLIYEKCSPLPVAVTTKNQSSCDDVVAADKIPVPTVNVSSPMHWGQKYEPVSTMYYDMIHGTVVGEYGCVQHSKYSFLGASPDGIVDDPASEKYGQMLEIKNVVNRDITGVPLKAYWVQMQLQLEVCDLEECDFLETRFKEYTDDIAFMEDCGHDNRFTKTCGGKWKGILLYFIDPAGVPVYEYKPIEMGQEEYETKWEPDIRQKHTQQGHTFMWPSHWWLDEISCVLVERNRLWFSSVIDQMSAFWDTILEERKSGYAHRAPSKRKAKDDGLGQCLITINGSLIGSAEQPDFVGSVANDDGFGQCLITINGSLIGSAEQPAFAGSAEQPAFAGSEADTPTSINIDPSQNTLDGFLIPSVPPLIPPENIVHIRTQSFDDVVTN